MKYSKTILLLTFLFATFAGPVIKGQVNAAKENLSSTTKDEKSGKSARKGTITGRVVGEDGKALLDAEIYVTPFGETFSQPSVSVTDKDGNFHADNLRAGSYSVSARAPGYVYAPEQDSTEPRFYRIGDSVSLKIVKGGVITGTVTDEYGEPLVSVQLRAIRLRDSSGRKPGLFNRFSLETETDDRGVYRIFGLLAGTYVVMAGGPDKGYYPFEDKVNTDSPPVFYPSSTADSAAEIAVQAGQEVSGIDIRFRTLLGHNINGVISNAKTFAVGTDSGINVVLFNLNTNSEAAFQNIIERDGRFAFSFGDLADGEYEIHAMAYKSESILATSQAQKITIKGADVSNLNIQFFKPSSLSGRIVLASKKNEKKEDVCGGNRAFSFDEFVVQSPVSEKESSSPLWFRAVGERGIPADETGAFTQKNLDAGKRRIIVKLPGDNLFTRSITGPAAAPSKQPLDIARSGITLKSGEDVKDVTVEIAEGAAKLSGRVVPTDETASALPENLLIHLVPGEKEAGDQLLRYFEMKPESDGSFTIANIPPGRYFILIRTIKAGAEGNSHTRPIAWDDLQREKLRREAETANQAIELSPCKRLADYVLRLK